VWKYLILLLIFLVGCGNNSSSSSENRYLLSYISDGDTIYFKELNSTRLISIDAPESHEGKRLLKQADNCAGGDTSIIKKMGEEATNHLKTLLKVGNFYRVKIYGKDIYNRTLATVYLDKESVNLRMVEDGYAVAYIFQKGQNNEEDKILEVMREAKENRIGLWKEYYNIMECIYELDNN